ncbi:mevalonate kinase [Methanobrevibacter filiformis]|nr:mevalonate kinase [Methanobrevibacter filiformis]
MEAIASAPGKTILFGEHSVVYKQPAIATAVNKRATISIKRSTNGVSTLRSDDLQFEAELDTENKSYNLIRGKPGIIRYILEALFSTHDHSPIDIKLSLNIPIGSGLGSSAAVTVATLAALHKFHGIKFNKHLIAKKAHIVERNVQGIASPLDTLVCTNGGMIYLSRDKMVSRFNLNFKSSFVIGYTSKRGNTGKMVRSVRALKNRNPRILGSIIKTMGQIVDEAKLAIISGNNQKIAELMNINQGLLDSIGVNTTELSRMVYSARRHGALGSKITGSGGGGSIIAFCPGKSNEVHDALNKYDNAIKIALSNEGVNLKYR